MALQENILDLIGPVAAILPEYHPYAADINEALDYKIASCAVRAYAAGLLIRHAYPNENLYVVNFGFAPEHGGDYESTNGVSLMMGHAVTRVWVPEQPAFLVESYNDSALEVVPPRDIHDDYIWMGLEEGYRTYLDMAGHDDVEVDPDEITQFLLAEVANLKKINQTAKTV